VAGNALVAATVAVTGIFAFGLIDPIKPLSAQWATYVNPFDNLFLFAAGVAIFYNLGAVEVRHRWRFLLLILPIIAFAAYPVAGDQVNIVTGAARVFFSAVSIAIVAGFYKAAPPLPKSAAAALGWLGAVSYGVYLIHPFIIDGLVNALGNPPIIGAWLFVLIVAGMAIAAASTIYVLIERPATNVGRIVATHAGANIARLGQLRVKMSRRDHAQNISSQISPEADVEAF